MHLELIARVLLAATFAVAGGAKLRDRAGFRAALAGFGVPARLLAPLAAVLPVVELAAALLLLLPATARAGALAGAALLLGFTGAIAWNLARGRRPDCRCFGQLSARPIGALTLARNAGLLGLAALVAAVGPGGGPALAMPGSAPTSGFERLALATAVVGGALLLALAWLAMQLLRQQGRLLARVALLEGRVAALAARPGAPAGEPGAPGPVAAGSLAPRFALPTLAGGEVSLDGLLAAGKPVLLAFVDPACKPCGALLPELVRWRREHADRLTVAVVSRGPLEANTAKLGGHDLGDVLLQRADEVADRYGVMATPGAVLVRADGRIGSAPAQGDEIARLVARVAAEPRPLAVGDAVPELRLADAEGREVALAALAALAADRERPTALLFWSSACAHCQALLPVLEGFVARPPAGAPALVLVETAAREAAARPPALDAPVLFDASGHALRLFGARGTPSAALIGADGRLAVPVAGGGRGVAELLGLVRGAQSPAA
ncbi:MAG TPA: MauE/DoxX family redox-associated membrane protein [Gemmatimonadales bacterium]|nr:MauE/DoxX family redox-associated membrane protein [Gemmatimonadales bacterium]